MATDGKKSSYRDLIVWQRAVDSIPHVYEALRDFPKVEDYALSAQIRRASVSIAANIAEGQARRSRKEFRQHLAIAKGSLAELHTLLIVAQRLGYSADQQLADFEDQLASVGRPLAGLMDRLVSEKAERKA
jgi:four helix bundle protein